MLRYRTILAVLAFTLSASSLLHAAPDDSIQQMRHAVRQQLHATHSHAQRRDDDERNVKWLGILSSGLVELLNDCTPDPQNPLGPDDRCIVVDNTVANTTPFDLRDIGRVTLPARSAHSLICPWMTPYFNYALLNGTGTWQQDANLWVSPWLTVENPVLDDPNLIDPNTGQPFGGKLSLFLNQYGDGHSLEPNGQDRVITGPTRTCIGGISPDILMQDYGLSSSVANAFFEQPTTLRVNLTGHTRLMWFGFINYSFRLVGD